MTSELKPCPFCGGKAKLKGGRLSQENYTVWCENLHKGSANSSKEKAIADWNTRAVPDVPELVRYNLDKISQNKSIMIERINGEYVRHDRAASVIAAKDAEIERLKDKLIKEYTPRYASLLNRAEQAEREAEAAEAKLAQIEKQEAWGWAIPKGGEKKPVILEASKFDEASAAAEADVYDLGYFALYTAPVASDADPRPEEHSNLCPYCGSSAIRCGCD